MNKEEIREAYSDTGKAGRKKYAIALIIIAVLVVSYLIFSFQPRQKPFMEKPIVGNASAGNIANITDNMSFAVNTSHVEYVTNELGSYKLHPSITGEEPEIELVVSGRAFAITLKNSKPVATEGSAKNPDIRLTTDIASMSKVFAAKNTTQEIINLYKEGKIEITLLKDQATLFLKGYKDIYDALQ